MLSSNVLIQKLGELSPFCIVLLSYAWPFIEFVYIDIKKKTLFNIFIIKNQAYTTLVATKKLLCRQSLFTVCSAFLQICIEWNLFIY